MRLGVLGGTFDPIHYGHLRMAEEALEFFQLDRMDLVLSADPPHKRGSRVAPAHLRWKWLGLACDGNPKLVPSDIEMNRPGPSYTIDTLAEVRNGLNSGDDLFFFVGMDCAEEIQTWKCYSEILASVNVVVAQRGQESEILLPPTVAGRVQTFKIPYLDISSSRIRKLVQGGQSIRYLVPEAVRKAVLEAGCYQQWSSRDVQEASKRPVQEVMS